MACVLLLGIGGAIGALWALQRLEKDPLLDGINQTAAWDQRQKAWGKIVGRNG